MGVDDGFESRRSKQGAMCRSLIWTICKPSSASGRFGIARSHSRSCNWNDSLRGRRRSQEFRPAPINASAPPCRARSSVTDEPSMREGRRRRMTSWELIGQIRVPETTHITA